MRELDPRRFEHHVSEPIEVRDEDYIEMNTSKRHRVLVQLLNASSHTEECSGQGFLDD